MNEQKQQQSEPIAVRSRQFAQFCEKNIKIKIIYNLQ